MDEINFPQNGQDFQDINSLIELVETELIMIGGGARWSSCWPQNNNPAQTAQDYMRCRQNAINNARR
jgi:hypothetical protein